MIPEMTEHEAGTVRITNQRIYDLVLETRDEVRSVRQSVRDSVNPSLTAAKADIENLKTGKADKTETTEIRGNVKSLQVQTYAVVSGVIGGLVLLKNMGII